MAPTRRRMALLLLLAGLLAVLVPHAPAAGLNVVVSDVTVSPDPPAPGEPVTIETTIDNADDSRASFEVTRISLLVAGISILNVMLMSAVERKEEIGVLRAVGFQRLDIVTVMVTEETLLGVAGAIVGAGLSLGFGALIYDQLLGDPNLVFRAANAPFVARGVAFGVLTAVVSGLYPAWKASRAEPVETLRG